MSEPIDAYKKLIDTLAFEGYPRHLTEDLLDEITTAAVIEELKRTLAGATVDVPVTSQILARILELEER